MNLDLVEMTITQCIDVVAALDNSIAVMIWGQPGLGKTFTLDERFTSMGYKIIPVLAGCSEPTDITGIPFDHKGTFARYLAPEWAFLASDHPDVPEEWQGPLVLFFDDIVTAPEQTQAAFYKTVHEKRVGNLRLRDNVRIIAAGNRIEDKSAATEMPKALCNRFAHFWVRPDHEVWLNWGRKNGMHPDVMGFIRKMPNRITNFKDALDSDVPAFATPRTWEMLSKSLFNLEKGGLRATNRGQAKKGDMTFRVASGIVGNGLAAEFISFIKHSHGMVSPEEICKDPKNVKIPGVNDIDVQYATISSAEHWISIKDNAQKKFGKLYGWQAMIQYSLRVIPEFGLILAKQIGETILSKLDNDHKAKAATSDEFGAMFEKWGDHLQMVQ